MGRWWRPDIASVPTAAILGLFSYAEGSRPANRSSPFLTIRSASKLLIPGPHLDPDPGHIPKSRRFRRPICHRRIQPLPLTARRGPRSEDLRASEGRKASLGPYHELRTSSETSSPSRGVARPALRGFLLPLRRRLLQRARARPQGAAGDLAIPRTPPHKTVRFA